MPPTPATSAGTNCKPWASAIYDRTAPAEVLERAAGAEILLTNKTVLTAEHMAALPELKYIGVLPPDITS